LFKIDTSFFFTQYTVEPLYLGSLTYNSSYKLRCGGVVVTQVSLPGIKCWEWLHELMLTEKVLTFFSYVMLKI